MIVPVGKNRLQVNQGGFRNESIFNNDIFRKIAITGEELDLKEPQTQETQNDPLLDQVMGEGANPGMRQDQQNQTDQQNTAADQAVATQAPIQGQAQEQEKWGELAKAVEEFVRQYSKGLWEMKSQSKDGKGSYTITFGPIGVLRG